MPKDKIALIGTLACFAIILVVGIAVWIPCWTFGAWCD